MDCCMPMSVVYYTGWLEPDMEGISKELFTLAGHFKGTVVGISDLQSFKLDIRNKIIGFSNKWYYLAKLFVLITSRMHRINHIYDRLDNWIYISSISKNSILTSVTGEATLPFQYYKRFSFIVVDNENQQRSLIKKGLGQEKVKVIYPGIDLKQFLDVPSEKPRKDFTVLFASSPPTIKELETRGVFDLLDAAQRLTEVRFVFLWRPWGDSFFKIKEEVKNRGLRNIQLIHEKIKDMRELYSKCHVVIAPFKKDGGKSCPTSIMEALACGRPVIVGPGVGIRDLINKYRAGLSYDDNNLVESIRIVENYWDHFASRTRYVAQKFFSKEKFINEYAKLYKEVLNK